MDLTLLYFDDCPNWLDADRNLRAIADETPGLVVHRQVVDTPEEAERTGFRGSPSIQVDGVDLFSGPDAPVGLACRVYRTPGGPAGAPTLDQLRSAIDGHLRRESLDRSQLVAMLASAGGAPAGAVQGAALDLDATVELGQAMRAPHRHTDQ